MSTPDLITELRRLADAGDLPLLHDAADRMLDLEFRAQRATTLEHAVIEHRHAVGASYHYGTERHALAADLALWATIE